MTRRKKTKYVHEGKYMAEVEVELVLDKNEWSPYLTLEDTDKLEHVRKALKNNDLQAAAADARIYELNPILAGNKIPQPDAPVSLVP